MFNSANVAITGGTFVQNVESTSNTSALEILYNKAAPGAFHISDERFDPPKCHPATRTAVLDDITMQVSSALAVCIIWLYGAAGAGKSSIAQSIAERFDHTDKIQATLLGSFFFFRASPLRNNARHLAASLAYQLMQAIPSTSPHILTSVKNHPAIFESSFQHQLEYLFMSPIIEACRNQEELRTRPRLIILDGLDECETPELQRHLLIALGRILRSCPIPLVVLIASRPEIHIQSTLDSSELLSSVQIHPIALNDRYDADRDIRFFLDAKFSLIHRTHPFKEYIPENWPQSKDIDMIVQKSSGQFIFAATIIRYVESLRHKPHERLRTALDASQRFTSRVSDSPFQQLDALYMQIFSSAEDTPLLLAILYLSLFSRDAVQIPREIEVHLRLEPGDVRMHLSPLTSLIRLEKDVKPIQVFHASLGDFLSAQERSFEFFVHQSAVHELLARAYLEHVLDSDSRFWLDAASRCVVHIRESHLRAPLHDLSQRAVQTLVNRLATFQPMWLHVLPGSRISVRVGLADLVGVIHRLQGIDGCYHQETWNVCLQALQSTFAKRLLVYLADSTTHQFLALVSFTDSESLTPLYFPSLRFGLRFGLTEEAWVKCLQATPCYLGDGIVDRPRLPTAPCSDVLRHFLQDEQLSRNMFIDKQLFAHAAQHCLRIIQTCHIAPMTGHTVLTWDEYSDGEVYCWAVRGMTSMLRLAPRDIQLIEALRAFDCDFGLVKNVEMHMIDSAKKAINDYLKTYSTIWAVAIKPPLSEQIHHTSEPVTADDSGSLICYGRQSIRFRMNAGLEVFTGGSIGTLKTYQKEGAQG